MSAPNPVEHAIPKAVARGRPHLGPREVITAALWPSLEALVDHARGGLDRSPYLADLLARHVGRPDLVRHSQLTITFGAADVCDAQAVQDSRKTRSCTVRVHPAVAHELNRRASDFRLSRATYVADAIAEWFGAVRRAATNEERLPLAM